MTTPYNEALAATLIDRTIRERIVLVASLQELARRIEGAVSAAHARHRDRLGELQGGRDPARLPVVIGIGYECSVRLGSGRLGRGHRPTLGSAPDGTGLLAPFPRYAEEGRQLQRRT